VVPVVSLNGQPVGQGTAGSMWTRMNALYESYRNSLRSIANPL